MRILLVPIAALSLGGCYTIAKTAVDVVTLPVKAVAKGADLATTSQSEADENRGRAQLAKKAGVSINEVSELFIYGNHSPTMFADFTHAKIGGKAAADVIGDEAWLKNDYLPTVGKRGAAIIEARGQSSAASAANAAINHVQTWYNGSAAGDWVSMGIPSTGAYGSPEGVIFSYPVTVRNGVYSIVDGLALSDFDKQMIAATGQELLEEREAIAEMLG